jgi:hypothetical protein
MSESTDPYLDHLGDQWEAARKADVPDLNEVRAHRQRFIEYLAKCVLEVMDGCNDCTASAPTGPRLRVITNDGPVRRSPRRMSSPIKTDEIRAFEARVNRVFGTDARAMTEWPTD